MKALPALKGLQCAAKVSAARQLCCGTTRLTGRCEIVTALVRSCSHGLICRVQGIEALNEISVRWSAWRKRLGVGIYRGGAPIQHDAYPHCLSHKIAEDRLAPKRVYSGGRIESD
jgi:hypothetical protein